MFQGSYVALVTPFKNNEVDEEKLREIVEFQIEQGTNGIVPCGCTGEAAVLTHEEQKRVIKIVIEAANKRVLVIAGTGSNSTAEAYDLTKYAKENGADAVLVITPYYNKPTPEGQFRHYAKLAEINIPIVLYNVPSRTGISMLPETIARLSQIKNIVAIKEASGSLDQISKIFSLCNITVLSGDDSLILPIMSVGGKGVISVVANIVPDKIAQMTSFFLNGDIQKAKEMHSKIFSLCKAMFIETNPIPVKTAMKLMGRLNGELRLPLCEMQPKNEEKLKKILAGYKMV